MRLLLAEADPAATRLLSVVLEGQGWIVDRTDTAEEVLDLARHYDYDAALLAQALPDMPGHETVRRLRAKGLGTPVVMLSSADHPAERVRALSAGADDVVSRRIDPEELVARLRAITRRARGHAQSLLSIGPVTLNLDSHEVQVHGRPVRFTGKEFALFELLVTRKGMTLTKDAILNHLYDGMDEPEQKIVDVFVCKMRKKLADAGAPGVIATVWGRGYIARDPADTRAQATVANGVGCSDVRNLLGLI